MEKYSIYCTEEQMKLALELGAPIYELDNEVELEERMSCEVGFNATFPSCGRFDNYSNKEEYPDITIIEVEGVKYAYVIPTAEQMIGFFRSKGIKFHFDDETNYWRVDTSVEPISISHGVSEQKELAAIDAALDYLSKNKK